MEKKKLDSGGKLVEGSPHVCRALADREREHNRLSVFTLAWGDAPDMPTKIALALAYLGVPVDSEVIRELHRADDNRTDGAS